MLNATSELVCTGLTFSYGRNTTLRDLSFKLRLPGFHGLVGPSGIGKSTLAKLMSGLLPVQRCEELVIPNSVVYCHSRERFPAWLTIGEHIRRVTPEVKGRLLTDLLSVFDLKSELLDFRPHQISSGQANRANLVRYLMRDFDVLLMDEALNNVDELLRYKIISALKRNFPMNSFLYISHQLIDVTAYANSILILNSAGDLNVTRGKDLKSYDSKMYDAISEEMKNVAALL